MKKCCSFFCKTIVFISLIYSQFGFEQWLHNDFNQPDLNTDKNYVHLFNQSNIAFIAKDDSNRIYSAFNGMEVNFLDKKQNRVLIQYINHFNRLKYAYEELLFNYKYANSHLNTQYFINNFKKIKPSIKLSVNNSGKISYQLRYQFIINHLLTFDLSKSTSHSNYDLTIEYDDFLFYLDDINKIRDINDINILLNFKKFFVEFGLNTFEDKIKNNEQHNQKISSPFNQNSKIIVNSRYYFSKNNNLKFSFIKNEKDFATYFNDNGIDIIKINKLNILSHKACLEYQKLNKNKLWILGINYQTHDILMSSRIRSALISNSLESSLGAPIINNFNTGVIQSKRAYLKYNNNFSYHISYIYDTFNINLKNTLLSSFGFPFDIEEDKFKYKYKKAIILGFGKKFQIKKYQFEIMFNQHIPIKIKSLEDYNNSGNSSNGTNKMDYGGGQLLFNVYKYI